MTILRALEIMKTHVVTVLADSTLGDAVDRMDLYQVDELPVVDHDDKLCGMLKEHDVASALAAMLDVSAEGNTSSCSTFSASMGTLLVKERMTTNIRSVLDTDELTPELIYTVLTQQRRLPVVDTDGKIVGTLNRVDIVQALFEGLLEQP